MDNTDQWKSSFQASRWFTRGWTLQELLAPTVVEFFSKEGDWLGDRTTLASQIHQITTIPETALLGRPLTEFTVDERLGWAKQGHTTRVEDQAYCLLGIFQVFMPLMYGEAENAFRRLKRKIIRRSSEDDCNGISGSCQKRRIAAKSTSLGQRPAVFVNIIRSKWPDGSQEEDKNEDGGRTKEDAEDKEHIIRFDDEYYDQLGNDNEPCTSGDHINDNEEDDEEGGEEGDEEGGNIRRSG